jgi:uncharacterized phage-like protein YoqJ
MGLFSKNKTCAFTGHRPEKLHYDELEAKRRLSVEIDRAIAEGFNTFIVGMARGIDMWAGEIVIERREAGAKIRLVSASPYDGFEKSWGEPERERYHRILKNADSVVFVSKGYSRGCFQIRNVYMVDRAERVIAAYNGEAGGTRNTILYAERKGVEVVRV